MLRRKLVPFAACIFLGCIASSTVSFQFVPTTHAALRPSFLSRTFQLGMVEQERGQRRQAATKEAKPIMNEEIRALQLRVVAPTPGGKDESFGIMSRSEALAKAKELGGLDLILINENSDPPVCKIVDYSKYRYVQEKKAKEVRKNSKVSEIKEVKMSYKIDVHDYDVRRKSALKFLRQGNRVKCTVMFKGREIQHDNLGYELLDKLLDDLTEACLRESNPKREGRNLSMILSPRPELMKAISDERRAEERAKKKRKKELLEQRAAKGAVGEEEEEVDNGDDDDDDDDDDSLDALLGGKDDITKELFD